jgi:hypothetical protein
MSAQLDGRDPPLHAVADPKRSGEHPRTPPG